jgi:hypothetical protein
VSGPPTSAAGGDEAPDGEGAATPAACYREDLKVNGLPVTVEVARA